MPSRSLTLEIPYPAAFTLAGIACAERLYRLCWAVNHNFTLNFSKVEDYEVTLPKEKEPSFFPMYLNEDLDTEQFIYLLSNKNGSRILLPEWKVADYLVVFQGEFHSQVIPGFIQSLNSLPMVQTSFPIALPQVKSINNLVF